MAFKGFGKKDSDKIGKEKTDKAMSPRAGAAAPFTGKMGGPANVPARPGGAVKNMASTFKRGGSVKRGR